MTCRECNDTGFVNMGPTDRGGVPVFELCRCQHPQKMTERANPDDLMDACEKLNALSDTSLMRLIARTILRRAGDGKLTDTTALTALGNKLCQIASAIETERERS